MLRQRTWSGAELRAFVDELKSRDPELFEELGTSARKALAGARRTQEGLDPAAVALNEVVLEASPAGENFMFETIVLTKGRPVLAIQRDTVDARRMDARIVDENAARVIRRRLTRAKPFLDTVIPAVGRIEVQNNPYYEWVGTGWLVEPGIIVTNRHVARAFATRDGARFSFMTGMDPGRPQTARIDFREEIGRADAIELGITEIVWIAPDNGPDVAFLKLAKPTAERVRPVPLARALPAPNAQVAVIGYPARDSRIPDSRLMDRIYGEVYDKKRLAPGQVIAANAASVQHDCTTLGGNSGSVVLDLATGEAAALHFSGVYLRSNYAVPAPTLRRLIDQRPWQGGEGRGSSANGGPAVTVHAATTTSAAVSGDVSVTIPLTINIRLGDAGAGAVAGAETLEEAARRLEERLAGNPDVVSVRPGYLFRNGWITSERAVVIRRRPEASATLDAAEEGRRLGVPVDIRDADPAELQARSFGLTNAEAAYRYVSNYKRPLTGKFKLGKAVASKIVCQASPDAGWPALGTFLDKVGSELVIAMYDFTAPHIVKTLERSLKGGGKTLRLVLDPKESLGEGTKANDLPEEEVLKRLGRIAGLSFAHEFVPMDGSRRPFDSAYHIKVAVIDGKRFWLSSGNWQSSNQPDIKIVFGQGQDPKPLRTYNRDWHAIVESATLAKAYRAHIDQDLADAKAFPATEALDVPPLPTFLVPEDFFETPAEELPARATYFAPHSATNVTVRPLLSPDNYAKETLAFVKRAKSRLLIQNQSFKPGKGETEKRFADILDVALAKQRAGLDVRIIFRKIGDVPDTLERIQDYGFDMEKVHLQTNCHTKGIIVDEAAVMLGSHNWTTAGVIYNRDASLIIEDAGVTRYFAQLFEFDWQRTKARSVTTARRRGAPEVIMEAPGSEAPVPKGYVRVSWHEWTGE